MGVKNTGIQVLSVFMTRTKLSKTGPKSPVIMVPDQKPFEGFQSGGTIITQTKLSVTGRKLGHYHSLNTGGILDLRENR